jgi:hypothetical protein
MRRALLAGPAARRRVNSAPGRVLPGSGFGPDPGRPENWRWSMRVEAATEGEHRIEDEAEAVGHPGHLTAATMIGEANLMWGRNSPPEALGAGSIESASPAESPRRSFDSDA